MPPESFDDVLKRATEVFGDKKAAIDWLHQKSTALGGKIPISLLSSQAGKNLVVCELERIRYGIVS